MRVTCLLVSSASLTAFATAGEIYNNLGPGNSLGEGGRIIQGPDVGTIGDVDQAARFTTNGNFHESIVVQATIGVNAPPNTGTGGLALQIWSDDGVNGPDTILASETLNITSTGAQVVDATFATLTLLPNTIYWVVLDGQDTFDGGWNQNELGMMGVTAGRTDGNPWTLRLNDEVYAMRIVSRVETVPEPASMAALGLGVAAILRRRRRA